MQTSMTMFTRPQTTRCPQIGPSAQYIYIYIYTTKPIIPTNTIYGQFIFYSFRIYLWVLLTGALMAIIDKPF